jgi:glutathione S-transferase
MSIALHGSSHSNYYNKAKLALLEKGVPFSEVHADTHSTDEAVLSASPLAKIPFLMSEQGALCESQAILDYIEARWPQPPLLPADPFAAAKVRELTTFIDWHLEIVARQLYGPAFFGGAALGEAAREAIRTQLTRNIAAFKRLAKFSPYVAGDSFTQADCAAFNNLPLVGMAGKVVFGEDLLLAGGVDYKPYIKLVGERAAAQRVVADRKAALAKR